MKRRQIFVILLSLILCISFSSFAFADDGRYDAEYGEAIKVVFDDENMAVINFSVPAKGKLTFSLSFTDKKLHDSWCFEARYKDSDELAPQYFGTGGDKYNSSKKAYTYTKTVSIEKGEYYLVSDAKAGSKMNVTLSYKPDLGKTSITKLTAKKKGFTVKYKKASNATGYQIRYSTSSKMTKAGKKKTTALSKTVTKLKAKKKYYVQVRAYRTLKVNGKTKTYWSAWSAKKSVKTK